MDEFGAESRSHQPSNRTREEGDAVIVQLEERLR
jgi:hypothetical protein